MSAASASPTFFQQRQRIFNIMAFAPKAGCPMCGIVSSALHSQINSSTFEPAPTSSSSSNKPDIVWRDENFTIYKEKVNPVSSKAHIIIAFNLHVPSIYTLSSTDLPLLVNIRDLSKRILSRYLPPPNSPYAYQTTGTPSTSTLPEVSSLDTTNFRIGFITPPFRDNKIPVTGHLHAHAYILPADLMGWWRSVAYGPLAWYDIDDLIAEIRESTSNNRIRGAASTQRPIDTVPGAGSRSGYANGDEITDGGLNAEDANLEEGNYSPRSPMSPTTPYSPTTATALNPGGSSLTRNASASASATSLLPSHQIPSVSV